MKKPVYGYVAHYPKTGALPPAEFRQVQVNDVCPWALAHELTREQAEAVVLHWNRLGKSGGYSYEVVELSPADPA